MPQDTGGQPFTNAEFTVDLLKPDGQQRSVIVSDQGDVREVSLPEGTLDQTGIYTFELRQRTGKGPRRARLEFVVFDSDSEKSQATASPESLRRMVLPTGDFGGKLIARWTCGHPGIWFRGQLNCPLRSLKDHAWRDFSGCVGLPVDQVSWAVVEPAEEMGLGLNDI